MFCPKCGSMLRIEKERSFCSCGYATKTEERLKEKIRHDDKEIPILSDINPFATEEHACPKCGFGKAVFIESQIAVRETWNNSEADKPSYVCGKCGFKDFVA